MGSASNTRLPGRLSQRSDEKSRIAQRVQVCLGLARRLRARASYQASDSIDRAKILQWDRQKVRWSGRSAR